jgi:hypothetical protein
MTHKERVDRAFRHEAADKVPIYQGGFSSAMASAVLGHEAWVGGGIQQYREARALWEGEAAHREYLDKSFRDACELCEKLQLDLVRTAYWRKGARPTARIDELTFRYGDPGGEWEIWRLDEPTETFMCVDRSPVPEPTEEDLERDAREALEAAERYTPRPEDFTDARKAIERFGATHGIPGSGTSLCIPRERVWLEATILHPEIVGRYLDAQVIRARKTAPVMVELGLRYLFGGGDFASKNGPFYSPRSFHELMLPRLKEISRACQACGAVHMFASDGDLWPVAEDLFGESGVGAFYEVDRNYMPFRKLRERFPRLTLLGGVRSEVLHRGTVAEVVEEARSAAEDAKAIRGCIIGCSNQIVAPTPVRNFWAMMETLERYR